MTHVHRELRQFSDVVMQSVMRHDSPIKYPPISSVLRSLAVANQVDLRDEKASIVLLEQLDKLKYHAPTLHISFPAEPSNEVLRKLVMWLRKEIDPEIIIQVGLQPSIAAGVILRTPNRQFDFSLRRHLLNNRDMLIKLVKTWAARVGQNYEF